MSQKNILLVGETWVSAATHYKGFDAFGSVTFHSGAKAIIAALAGSEFTVTHMAAHQAVEDLPFTLQELNQYDAILLSDIGANSLLLHPDVWLHGKTVANRLDVLRDWTAQGGALAMFGGYLSFQGIDGKARWHRTAVEQALPVTCLPYDDRIEVPQGFQPQIATEHRDHPLFAQINGEWPLLLGANEVIAKEHATVLARLPDALGGHPLLVTGQYHQGRTLVWTSDISPHWLPQNFIDWPGYKQLLVNMLTWLTQKHTAAE
ncbi:MAG: glutamine amidotransferase [Rouxiella aceris]|uniref:glutamine amidotransferase n=1 Tax=Rouxiella aceris TaxID=2703884 RepID=UPI00283C3AF9|nr:glutamine amidotransferase [Rouxiella aceris]MDR3432734.1 glutamine amidotransferase [Rouxiella aceris]